LIAGKRFQFSPLVFSQVNAAAAEQMVDLAGELLEPHSDCRLVDLYCGFGVFALTLAPRVRRVIGVESSPHALAAALANVRAQRAQNVRFVRAEIDGDNIHQLVGTPAPNDLFLLDPPRSGTRSGVVEAIAARRPLRVLHIFCNPDLIPAELARWTRSGYRVTRAVPVDIFPGTDAVEVMVVLERA
jgi:tRNA/tmRNA/rRNA uracil-C5-methylase (TrmA/RlmC/RlmD family)